MSIMSMQSANNNMLPSMVSSESGEQKSSRKRYLDDLELPPIDEHKRLKTTTSLPSSPTSNTFTSLNIAEPLIHHSSNIPYNQYQYLSHSESRYFSSSPKHSLDYPDTCINDEDWRYNLEFWINKNFPEKFQNLKTVLKFDKPGFDLLNDAILISELNDELNHQIKPQDKTPKFTSKISRKMTASYIRNPTGSTRDIHGFYNISRSSASPKAVLDNNGSLSEDEYSVPSTSTSLKPIISQANHGSSYYQSTSTTSGSSSTNYTYTNSQLLSPPLTNASLSGPSSQPVLKSTRTTSLDSPKVTLPSLNIKEFSSATTTPSLATFYPQSPESLLHNKSKPMSSPAYKPTSPTIASSSSSRSPPSSPSKTNFIHTTPHKTQTHSYTIHHHHLQKRQCISCHSDQSPCWRPSWSLSAGQLCNSCGLRYKKTGARCINSKCGRIPSKGEWTAMKTRGKVTIYDENGKQHLGYKCLHCDNEVEVKIKGDPRP